MMNLKIHSGTYQPESYRCYDLTQAARESLPGPLDHCHLGGPIAAMADIEKLRLLAAPGQRSQKLANYVTRLGRQNQPGGCFEKIADILQDVFPQRDVRQGPSLGPLNRKGAPTEQEIDALRHSLQQNEIPLWLIRGQASGQHWIAVLGVDDQQRIRYFDPADGKIHCRSSRAKSIHGYFFGSPKARHLKGNQPERGYRFAAAKS